MQIIKDRQIVDNTWTYIADDAELANGDITVSLSRWNNDRSQLSTHTGKIGVRVSPADDTRSLAADLDKLNLIEIDFPGFGDGRGFSHARLLRSALNYSGELRAVGKFLPDQVFYLSRVGFDAFQLANDDQLPLALSTLDDFSVHYQASSR